MNNNKSEDNAVVVQTAIISSILLGIFLTLLNFGYYRLVPESTSFYQAVKLGISLLVFWLVVTSGIRSVQRLRPRISGGRLLLTGLLIAGMGILTFFFIQQVLLWAKVSWSGEPNYKSFLFFLAIGAVVSVISLINLRVKNQMLGNVLEVLVIALVAYLFFFFMK